MDVLERIDGNQAGKSSTTNILLKTFRYELIVLSEMEMQTSRFGFNSLPDLESLG